MIMKIKKTLTTFLFVSVSMIYGAKIWALPEGGIVPSGGKADGNYSLNDLLLVLVNVSTIILEISGALALLAFIIGGFMFILSSGNKEMVEKGKSSIKGAVIGLIVVLLAYTAIDFFMTKIGYVKTEPFGAWNSTN